MPVRIVFSVEIITGSIFSNGLDQKFYYKEVHTSVKIPVPSAKKKKKRLENRHYNNTVHWIFKLQLTSIEVVI